MDFGHPTINSLVAKAMAKLSCNTKTNAHNPDDGDRMHH
jgi:hypothetical protein